MVGAGPPLVCHPGGPGLSATCFGDLPELAAERTLLLLDPRGTGASDRPADPSAYDLEDYAADIEALRDHLGLERLDLLGHSHGGFVAMTWAGANPERVGSLVLASTAPRFTDAIREARAERVASHAGEPYFEDAMEAMTAHREGRYSSDAELDALFARGWRLQLPVGEDADAIVATLAASGTNADALTHFNDEVAAGMDQRGALAGIDAPTLVITGAIDPFGAPAADEIADALPNASLVVLPETDHFPFLASGRRAAWSQAVLDFLE